MWKLTLCCVMAAGTSIAEVSPAERRIAAVEQRLNQEPKRAALHAEYAEALLRRARETGDAVFLERAERQIVQALRLEAECYEAKRARLAMLVAREEFTAALELGASLNRQMPDDAAIYGLLADAEMGLGRYEDAGKHAQWMINLRRANLGAMTRGALLREVWGDAEGAIEWLQSAFRLTSASEVEERAWIAVQMARVRRNEGRFEDAAKLVERAEVLFRSPAVREERARLELARGNRQAAAEAARQLRPHPRNLYLLAQATGQEADWIRFRVAAEAAVEQGSNANRELVFDLIERDPKRAVELARREAARRADILTLYALASAEGAAGDLEGARRTVETLLRTGTRHRDILLLSDKLQSGLSATKPSPKY